MKGWRLWVLILAMPSYLHAQVGEQMGGEDMNRPREISLVDLMGDPAFAWFPDAFHSYASDSSILSEIRPYIGDYHWLVFMGAWCSDSYRWIPPFFRIGEDLDIPQASFRILSLDEMKKDGGLGLVDSFKVEWIPTMILMRGDEEIGRIVETVELSLEIEIVRLIEKDRARLQSASQGEIETQEMKSNP